VNLAGPEVVGHFDEKPPLSPASIGEDGAIYGEINPVSWDTWYPIRGGEIHFFD